MTLLWGQAPRAQGIPGPAPAPKEKADQGAGNDRDQPAPIRVELIESARQAKADEAREAKSDQHDAEDLQAQIRAAKAAEDQIFPAWLAAVLSFIGTLLIIWTLIESRRANRLSREAMHRQLRAYLTIDSAERGSKDGWETVTLKLSNSGATPAAEVTIESSPFEVKEGKVVETKVITRSPQIGGQTKIDHAMPWYVWGEFVAAKLPHPDSVTGSVIYSVVVPDQNGKTETFTVPFEFEPASAIVGDAAFKLAGEPKF